MPKITDILSKNRSTVISLEITPPDKGGNIEDIFRSVDLLLPYDPQFINVTYHQPFVEFIGESDSLRRIVRSKKPGTVGVSSAIQNRYGVDAVPHILCGGQNKYSAEDALIDLNYLGIENVFAVRGDPPSGKGNFIPEKDGYAHASELVQSISDMNRGIYLNSSEISIPTNFCIGVAGYPEKHSEAPDFDTDLRHLKEKVEKGADFIITQMSFDFEAVKNFVEKIREAGVKIPVIPGIKPVTSLKQVGIIPKTFGIKMPQELIEAVNNAKTKKEEFAQGIKFMSGFVEKLLDYGFPGIHLFTMGKGASSAALLESVFGKKQ